MRNRYMHIRWNEEKQDIEDRKQDIGAGNPNIIIPDLVGNKTKGNIMKLFAEYGYDSFFWKNRSDATFGVDCVSVIRAY